MAHLTAKDRNEGRWDDAVQAGVILMELSKNKLGMGYSDVLLGRHLMNT